MIKCASVFALIVFTVFARGAIAPGFEWARSISGNGNDTPYNVASDRDGNSYVIGESRSAITAFGSITRSNASFILGKCDPAGNPLWFKGYPASRGVGIAADKAGNVYVCGTFSSATLNFGITNLTRSSAGFGNDAFVAKLSSDGEVQWVRQIISTNSGGVNPNSLSVAGTNVFVSFQVLGSAQWGSVTATNTHIALASLTIDGDLNFFTRVGDGPPGSSGEGIGSVAAKENGSVCVGGFFSMGTLVIGTNVLTNAGSQEGFVAKFLADGACSWVRQLTGTSADRISSVACLPDGSFAALGYSGGPATFAGASLSRGTSLARLDSSGNPLWTKTLWDSQLFTLAADGRTNLYVGGQLSSFVPDPHPSGLVIAKFDGNGNFQWWTNAMVSGSFMSGAIGNAISGMAVDAHDGLVACGYFGQSILQFPMVTFTNVGQSDGFVTRLTIGPPRLRFGVRDSSMLLSWSMGYGDFALEISDNFTNWASTNFTTNTALGICESSNLFQSSPLFFRLKSRD